MKDEPNLHLTPYRMKHLTRSQRDQLMVLHRAGHKQREIADLIGVDQSSVSRELIRNSSLTGRYTANTAQKRAEKRRKEVDTGLPRWHDDTDLLGHVLNELRDGKSPEQIAGRMKQQEHKHQVSHQAIYDYISADKDKGGVLYKHLRYQGKKYKWRDSKKETNGFPAEEIFQRDRKKSEKKNDTEIGKPISSSVVKRVPELSPPSPNGSRCFAAPSRFQDRPPMKWYGLPISFWEVFREK
jgi:IS30 family transposase